MKPADAASPDLSPALPEDCTPAEAIAAWVDLMNTCEQFLLAGLRREIGPEGDLQEAYRRWYAADMEEHDRTMRHMVDEFNRCWNAPDG